MLEEGRPGDVPGHCLTWYSWIEVMSCHFADGNGLGSRGRQSGTYHLDTCHQRRLRDGDTPARRTPGPVNRWRPSVSTKSHDVTRWRPYMSTRSHNVTRRGAGGASHHRAVVCRVTGAGIVILAVGLVQLLSFKNCTEWRY